MSNKLYEENDIQAIANAIRGKNGSSDTYTVAQMAQAIANIPSGGSGGIDWSEIGYEGTPQSIIDGYNYAKEIKENWDSSITSMTTMFKSNTRPLFMPLVDTTNVTTMIQTFAFNTGLLSIPLLNTSNVTNMADAFHGCSNLVSIPPFDTSNVTTIGGAFASCSSLVDVPIFNLSKIRAFADSALANLVLNCPELSDNSLNNIMASCITATKYQSKNLKKLGLTQDQATRCQSLSNYQAFLDAGWTTGY